MLFSKQFLKKWNNNFDKYSLDVYSVIDNYGMHYHFFVIFDENKEITLKHLFSHVDDEDYVSLKEHLYDLSVQLGKLIEARNTYLYGVEFTEETLDKYESYDYLTFYDYLKIRSIKKISDLTNNQDFILNPI